MPGAARIAPEMPALPKRRRKQKIPKAIREAIWLRDYGHSFEGKCQTSWCSNTINAWDFQAGHNVPESKGGKTVIENLIPLCSRCNLSMSNSYTFSEWCALSPTATQPPRPHRGLARFFSCFQRPRPPPGAALPATTAGPLSVVGTSNPTRRRKS